MHTPQVSDFVLDQSVPAATAALVGIEVEEAGQGLEAIASGVRAAWTFGRWLAGVSRPRASRMGRSG